MSKNMNSTLNSVSRLRRRIRSLWNDIHRHHWSFETYSDKRKEIMASSDWQNLPRWAIEYLRGYGDSLYDSAWEHVVYSYEIDGRRITVGSSEWRAITDPDLHALAEDHIECRSGQYVWRDDPTKIWY